MKTPAGKECRYFYGSYHRGRDIEECRLLSDVSPAIPWKPSYCETCPVPGILLANACQDMVLLPRLSRSLLKMKQQLQVKTYCNKTGKAGFDPHIGCGECHSLPPEIMKGMK
jgi:hypothetical protein